METLTIDLKKKKSFEIGQQGDHNALCIHFINMKNIGTNKKYIYYTIDGIENCVPLTNDRFIVGYPLTAHSGIASAQLISKLNDNTIIKLSNVFAMNIKESKGYKDSGEYPVDPNIQSSYDLLDDLINQTQDLINNYNYATLMEKLTQASSEATTSATTAKKCADELKNSTDFINTLDDKVAAQDSKIEKIEASTSHITTKQNTKIAVLQTRMSEFTSLKDGSTTGDAELIDARIGTDGTKYASAGDAMRGQVEQLNEALIKQDFNNRAINLLSFVDWTDGKYIYITGVISDNTDYSLTSLIKCVPNTEYSINVNTTNAFIVFYDINRNYINGILQQSNGNIITPNNAYYIRYSCFTSDKDKDTIINLNPFVDRKEIHSIYTGFNSDILYNVGWKRGYYLSTENGTELEKSGLSHTIDYSLCGGGKMYSCPIFTDSVYICFYDSNKNFISGTSETLFTTPNNCKYLRLSTISDHEACIYLIAKDSTKEISISNGDDIQKAINIAANFNVPLIINGGEYDVSNIGGVGLSVRCDIFGVGNPTIKANLLTYNENFSIFNFDLTANKKAKIDGLHLIANNCRYAIHCEMGGNKDLPESEAYYRHEITNCIITVNDDKRCVGCGLGDNGYLLIDNCQLNTNSGDYAIAIHSGYNGQRNDTKAVVTNCYMNKTVQAQSINSGDSGYLDTVIVNNCSMETEPILETTGTQNVKLLKWNNNIRS